MKLRVAKKIVAKHLKTYQATGLNCEALRKHVGTKRATWQRAARRISVDWLVEQVTS